MSRTRSIAGLIINWNGAKDTLDLLRSLCHCQSESVSITAVVIDNASSSEDVAILEGGLGEFAGQLSVVFRANNTNIGVPAAYNQAIQLAGLTHDHYLRLDNDVIVEPDGLTEMIEVLEQRAAEGIAIVGGTIKYFDRREDNNGGAVTFDLIRGTTRVDYPPSDVICDGVLGCIMLVAGDLVRRHAPEVFESKLFICTDESELSLRAAAVGMKTLYLARLIGFHKSGKSTSKVKFVTGYYVARNWTVLRLRYVAGGERWLLLLVRMPMDVARSVLRRRWAFPPGLVAGLAMVVTSSLDRRVRRGEC